MSGAGATVFQKIQKILSQHEHRTSSITIIPSPE